VDANPSIGNPRSRPEPPLPRKFRRKRWLRNIAIALASVYLAIVVLLWAEQEWFIFPGHGWQGQQWTIVESSADHDVIPFKTSLGDQVYLYFGKATDPLGAAALPDASSRPTILFFYGNGDEMQGTTDLARLWRTLGTNVAVLEYPGYGMSGGKPGELAFYAAADAAFDALRARADVNDAKIIVAGQSAGTGVAVDLASRKPVAAVALFSGYTTMQAMAHHDFPWLPTSLILRHHFRNIDKIGSITAPILIVHGTEDRRIPVSMSRELAAAAKKAQVTTLFISADHNDVFTRGGVETSDALRNLINAVNTRP
jgi:pimeloyl-ACP methyl ester carboxylesterase